MSHATNKVDWCLKKAQREGEGHRGLVKVQPNSTGAHSHINKAIHYLEATEYNKRGGFTDICTTTLFYATYQSFLAIALRYGYESRNQECTFALMHMLAEEGRISLDKAMLEKVASLTPDKKETSVKIRERMQYGTEISLGSDVFSWLEQLAKDILEQAKEIIEEHHQ